MTTRRWIYFAIAILIGLGIGLFYGWVISPVQYVNTAPDTLRIDFRTDYTLMVAEVFQKENNISSAEQRLALLGSQPPVEIASAALSYAQTHGYASADVALLQNLVSALQISQPGGQP